MLRSNENLLALDVVEEELAGRSFLAPGLDDDAGAADNLDSLAFSVVLADASPLAEGFGVLDLDERNGMFLAQRSDELAVRRLVAAGRKAAQVSLAAIQSCCGRRTGKKM